MCIVCVNCQHMGTCNVNETVNEGVINRNNEQHTHSQLCVCVVREKRKIIDQELWHTFCGSLATEQGSRTLSFTSGKSENHKKNRILPSCRVAQLRTWKSSNTLEMPLNRAQLRSLTLMKIVFPQVLWKMQQMICKCLALVFPSSVFKFSALGMQHFAFLTCCHLHTCCHFLYACMCVRLCVCVIVVRSCFEGMC